MTQCFKLKFFLKFFMVFIIFYTVAYLPRYSLDITDKITVTAKDEIGIYYGLMSVIQMLKINDKILEKVSLQLIIILLSCCIT